MSGELIEVTIGGENIGMKFEPLTKRGKPIGGALTVAGAAALLQQWYPVCVALPCVTTRLSAQAFVCAPCLTQARSMA